MSTEIKRRVQSREMCQIYSKMKLNERMFFTQQPEFPFHTVYMDLMDLANKPYRVVMDKYSTYMSIYMHVGILCFMSRVQHRTGK